MGAGRRPVLTIVGAVSCRSGWLCAHWPSQYPIGVPGPLLHRGPCQTRAVLRVGLTGGIAAGKSTVARRLAGHGAVLVDADVLAREVVRPGSAGLVDVVEAFGPDVLADDGSLDRAALGSLIFADPSARARLESITHPRIRTLSEARFAVAPDDSVVVHDVPLLVELGYEEQYHLVVVVHAEAEERVRRLVVERGSDEADARRRVAAQADDAQRRRAADVWLDSTVSLDDLLAAVDALWCDRLVPFERNVRERRRAPVAAEVSVVAPEESWAATGRRLVSRVRRAAGERAMAVDHVGSTSVPGLVAKDVIDLQLVVADLATADSLAPALAAAGFPPAPGTWQDTPKPDGEGGPWEKRLHGSADPARPVHLHVRTAGSPGADYALLFRDWLTDDDGSRDEYAALKQRLASEHRLRTDYAEAKEPWFTDVAWPRMQAWAGSTRWARSRTVRPPL